jgi:hypothetical protein
MKPFAPFLLLFTLAAAHADEPKTVRLFTVGNSFSNNATKYLPELAKAGGHTLVMRTASVGGAPLALHWGKAEAFEKDPTAPEGQYGNKKGLKEELRAAKWDVVTIQQASIQSHDIETYRPYAKKLAEAIRAAAPDAKLMLHQTWAYRADDKRFAGVPKAGEPGTRAEMHAMLTKAYRTIAGELGAGIVPVGDAFDLAETDPKWGFAPDKTFDPKKAEAPMLPDQSHSLHVGWKWTKGTDGRSTLSMDGHHANEAGQYLGACVFYEVLFREDVTANPFVPKGMDAEYAKFLRATAHKAVQATRPAK